MRPPAAQRLGVVFVANVFCAYCGQCFADNMPTCPNCGKSNVKFSYNALGSSGLPALTPLPGQKSAMPAPTAPASQTSQPFVPVSGPQQNQQYPGQYPLQGQYPQRAYPQSVPGSAGYAPFVQGYAPGAQMRALPNKQPAPGTWSAGRLTLGIIGIVVSAFFLFEFFIIFWGEALLDSLAKTGRTGNGIGGMLAALGILVGAIINIASRNSPKKSGNIAAMVAHLAAALLGLAWPLAYSDQLICGAIGLSLAIINLGSLLSMTTFGRKPSMSTLILVGAIVLSLVAPCGAYAIRRKSLTGYWNKGRSYELEETFEFNGLEITVHDDIYVDSDNGVHIPVTIKNVSKKPNSLGKFDYYTYDDNNKLVLSSLYGQFRRDSVETAGLLDPGESYDKTIYCAYNGDGTYYVLFKQGSVKISVEFEVKK